MMRREKEGFVQSYAALSAGREKRKEKKREKKKEEEEE
jgi:hypothetical protein